MVYVVGWWFVEGRVGGKIVASTAGGIWHRSKIAQGWKSRRAGLGGWTGKMSLEAAKCSAF